MRKKPFTTFAVDPLPAFRNTSNHQKGPNEPTLALQPLRNSPNSQEFSPVRAYPIKPTAQPILHQNYQQTSNYPSRPGNQISRLTHTIDQLASRPKVIFASSKQNSKASRIVTPSSSFTSSTTSLPRLDRTFDQSGEESKLMEQIRRVENRIKELKFERNETSLAQKNFDMIRPFLEIQNQNMVNLQMMILAQNNRPLYGGHCHSLDRFASHPYSSVPYSVRETTQSDPDSEEDPDEKKYKNKAKKKKQDLNKTNPNRSNKKKYNLVKLRKFRAAVIAVYFSLLFPKYSNKFTLKRYRLHAKEFYTKVDRSQEVVSSFIEDMLSLNSVKISEYVRSVRIQKTQRRVAKTAKLIITQQYEGKKNFQFFIGDVQLFLLQYLKKIESIIEDGGLDSTIRYIGCGNSALSFPIDDYHLLQQIYRVTFDPNKIYLKLTPQQSKALIISTFMIKILIFGYFFVIKDSFELKKKLQKQHKLKNQQMIEVQLAATEMYFSGILLHQYCMDLIRETLSASNGNGSSVNPSNLPIPKKSLIFSHFGDIEKALGADVANKPLKRNSVSSGTSQQVDQVQFQLLDIEQHEDELLYEFAYIKNLQHFEQLLNLIKRTSDFQTQIKDKIMDIVDLVSERIKTHRRDDYRKIKQEMLLDEKHILKHKVSVEELKMPKRNAEERQFLKRMAQIIEENKQLEQQRDSSDQDESEESVASLPQKQPGKGKGKRAHQAYEYSSTSSK